MRNADTAFSFYAVIRSCYRTFLSYSKIAVCKVHHHTAIISYSFSFSLVRKLYVITVAAVLL